jgi:hypothetical protein
MSSARRQSTRSASIPVRIAVQHRCVDHRREEIVRRTDRVNIASEVEVEILHRHHLAIAAACGPDLDAEHRPE